MLAFCCVAILQKHIKQFLNKAFACLFLVQNGCCLTGYLNPNKVHIEWIILNINNRTIPS